MCHVYPIQWLTHSGVHRVGGVWRPPAENGTDAQRAPARMQPTVDQSTSRQTAGRLTGGSPAPGSSQALHESQRYTVRLLNTCHYFHGAIIWAIDAVPRSPRTQEWCSTAARWSPRSCLSSPSSPRSCLATCACGQCACWSRSTRPSFTRSFAAATTCAPWRSAISDTLFPPYRRSKAHFSSITWGMHSDLSFTALSVRVPTFILRNHCTHNVDSTECIQ